MFRRGLNVLVIMATACYTGVLLGVYVLRAITPADGLWWLAFASVWEPWWYLPLPLLIAAAAVSVRPAWLAVVVLVVPAGLWLYADGELFLPNAAVSGERRLVVMTFNLRYDHNQPALVLEAIRNADADVMAFQELTPQMDRFLWSELEGAYPYRLSAAADAPWGSGIFSRYPLTLVEVRAMNDGLTDTQEAVLDWNGIAVRVINLHTGPPTLRTRPISSFPYYLPTGYVSETRRAQIADLTSRLAGIDSPVVLACDCNMDPASQDYQLVASTLVDSYQEAGWGYGHTLYFNDVPNLIDSIPLVRIDYIFHSRYWQAAWAKVLPYAGSNHRPVVAELVLP